MERALSLKANHGTPADAIAPSSSSLAVDTLEASSRSESDRLLPRHPSEQRNIIGTQNYSTIVPAEDQGRQKPLHDDGSLRSMYAELRHTRWTPQLVWQKCVATPVSFLPAVVLGLLLNLLDAVSYGK